MYKRILVGIDWSEPSIKAAEKAAEMASATGGEVTLLTVVPPPATILGESMAPEVIDTTPLVQSSKEKARKLVEELSKKYNLSSISAEVVVGEPAEVLVTYALKRGYDLIVLGKKKLSSLEKIILGSIAKKVVDKSPVDVLIVSSPVTQK